MAIDLPGFGATPPPSGATGAYGYAERLVPVMEGLPRPPVLLGHSFGGRVAVVLAATRPDLVSSLVLTGVPLTRRTGGRRPAVGYRLARRAHRWGLLSDDRMEDPVRPLAGGARVG